MQSTKTLNLMNTLTTTLRRKRRDVIMCKIVLLTNASKVNVKRTSEIIGNILLETERDGFGYAVQGKDGVFGEKTIAKSFQSRLGMRLKTPNSIIKAYYSSFGKQSAPIGPMILHGRISTNEPGLINTHPMIIDNNYLVHNGVVTDHGPSYVKQTSNDSEDVLRRFLNGTNEVEKYLSGYYAFGCIDSNKQLHVVRDNIATLFVAWINEIESFMFATTPDLIDDVCDDMQWTCDAIDEVADNIHMIFNGNDLTFSDSIKPRGYDYQQSQYAEKSLGRSLVPLSDYISDDDEEEYSVDYDWSVEEFKRLIKDVDDTCNILDGHNFQITASQFHQLPFNEQKKCLIETANGEYIEFWYKTA